MEKKILLNKIIKINIKNNYCILRHKLNINMINIIIKNVIVYN